MSKKLTALFCTLIFLFALVHSPVCAEAQEDYDPQFTMLTLNMAIVSVYNIVSTQDRIVLDQEYENIINNLKLGNIEDDYEIKALYDELMLIISNTRLREEEKVRFLEKFDRREKEAIVGAISGIRAYGGDPWSFLGSLLTSSVSAYFSYRDSINQMQHELGDEMWQLRKEQVEDFDDLQRRLLNSSWSLLRKYRLPDEYRITQRDLDDFSKAVQEPDKSRAVRMFKALEANFKAYPTFWYFYGRAAMMNSDEKQAEKCFEEFERIWRPVLRQDPYKLEVAKHRVESLVKRHAPKEEIMKQLAIVTEHAPRANWNAKLFLGVMHFALGEKKAGIEFVEENIFFDIEKDLSAPILRSMEQDRLDMSQLGSELQAALQERVAKEAERQKEEARKAAEIAATDPEQAEVEKGLIAYFENRDEEVEKIFGPLVQTSRNPIPANVLGFLKMDVQGKMKNVTEGLDLLIKRDELLQDESKSSKTAFLRIFVVVEKFAKEGNVRAQTFLGEMCETGRGVPQDDRQAADWFRKAAEQGYAKAQDDLGRMYRDGRGVPQDDSLAVDWFRKAAEQGNTGAQSNLGWMYATGRGVLQSYQKAIEWYRKAAEQGYINAQTNLGSFYEYGMGVQQDDRQAVGWYRKAAEKNDAKAQMYLGWMYANGRGVPQDDTQAVEWYLKAAQQGDAAAQTLLGDMYKNGRGVLQDDRKAVEWFHKGAEQGYSDAQNSLGLMYDSGKGVPQNDRKAAEWFEKAANQGHVKAQFNLGVMFENGRGVLKDDGKALEWYRKAAEQGDARAQSRLGYFYYAGKGVEKNNYQAKLWFEKSAVQGNAVAQNNLGAMYHNGFGVPKNYEVAYFYYYLSRLNGNEGAQSGLDEIEGKGLLSRSKLSKDEIERARRRATQKYEEQRNR